MRCINVNNRPEPHTELAELSVGWGGGRFARPCALLYTHCCLLINLLTVPKGREIGIVMKSNWRPILGGRGW
jgi:hypothetical protein